jgi:hypothetical protein
MARGLKPRERRRRVCRPLVVFSAASLLSLTLLWIFGRHLTAKPLLRARSAPPTLAPLPVDDRPNPRSFDLDILYPAELAYWSDSRGSPAPWIEILRAKVYTQASGFVPIPRTIHQTWKDKDPPRVLFSPRWSRSLRAENPEWKYRLWTDGENRALVSSCYPELLSMYDGYGSPIQRADVARYLIADTHGGMYADLDTECFSSFSPLLQGATLLLSYKAGANFSRGACNSIFGSAKGHPFWAVVKDVLRNRSGTPLSGHTAVLYATGPAVLREAVRRLLRLPEHMTITSDMMAMLRARLGIVVLDANILHPVTAERRTEARQGAEHLPAGAVCTHHFVSSWVAHSADLHADTEHRRQQGDATAAVHGQGQPVLLENRWESEAHAAANKPRKGQWPKASLTSSKRASRGMGASTQHGKQKSKSPQRHP